jgi:GNAT superfamily N-acetyltransferase
MALATRSTIRHSNSGDTQAIRTWLTEEEARGIPGNFLCNWTIIESAHRNRKLLVYVDGRSKQPVAFQLGGLVRPGILQVRNEFRRQGIGKKLVERCISLAYKQNQCLLLIECKPSSSIPFWESMGFTVLTGDPGKNQAYRILPKPLSLPEDGIPADVSISFYPEKRQWQHDVCPHVTFAPMATTTDDGTIFLGERILFHEGKVAAVGDTVVEIVVDGEIIYLNKAKYEDAAAIGLVGCPNGYYMDKIVPNNESDA